MNIQSLCPYRSRAQFYRQFAWLYVLTIAAQLSNIAYQKLASDMAFTNTLLPSLIFLSVLTIPALWIGLVVGKSLGLGLINQSYTPAETLLSGIKFAVSGAIVLGGLLLILRWALASFLPETLPEYGFRGFLGGVLVSLGAGLGEEIWFRFGLMTLLLLVCQKALKSGQLNHQIVIIITLFVGILFGLAHLPQLLAYGANSIFAVWATMLGNTCVAVLYGWCYWRYGLIAAIVAHFSLDIMLHALPAMF